MLLTVLLCVIASVSIQALHFANCTSLPQPLPLLRSHWTTLSITIGFRFCDLCVDFPLTGCNCLATDRLRQGSDYEAKRLGRAVEATLERLYEESQRPSDETLQGFFELHKGVPRRKVIDWFAQRRRMDQAKSNQTRSQAR